MLTKEVLLEAISKMPEEFFDDVDILLERIVMLEKIYKGIDQADRGEVISFEDLQNEMKEWWRLYFHSKQKKI